MLYVHMEQLFRAYSVHTSRLAIWFPRSHLPLAPSGVNGMTPKCNRRFSISIIIL